MSSKQTDHLLSVTAADLENPAPCGSIRGVVDENLVSSRRPDDIPAFNERMIGYSVGWVDTDR